MKCDFAGIESREDYLEVLDRARAALLGAAIGDALGATVEFMSPAEIRLKYGVHDRMAGGGWLYLKPGQVTDDTEMSIWLARGIVEKGTFDLQTSAEKLAAWLKSKPVDVGSTCAQGLSRYLVKGTLEASPSDWHAGNGAAMRMGPVAVASFGSSENLGKWAVEQARFTHNHPLSDSACIAIGQLVHGAFRGEDKDALRKIAESFPQFPFEPFDRRAGGYIVETMAAVLSSFFSTGTFRDCLVTTVNLGQDADTNGSIAGLIAGAYYGTDGLPRQWLGKLDSRVREELNLLAEKLLRISAKG